MILFTGDLFIGDKSINIDDKVLNLLNRSDFIVTNFENVLESNNIKKREDKSSILQFSISSLDDYLIKAKSRLLFTLGNNHMNDLGQEGIETTKTLLNKYSNLDFTGIGYFKEVIKPKIIEDNGKKIALLCLSTDEPEVMSVIATNKIKGVLDYNDNIIFDIIAKYKKLVDYFIIIPHWGREYVDYPSVQLRKKAYKWIDAGVDLIIGHHPHIIQGKEKYKDKWIYYSLGNYIFPEFYNKNGVKYEWKSENSRSIILQVEFLDTLLINDYGLFYNTKNNMLSKNIDSMNQFLRKSDILNIDEFPIKNYFGIWEKNYLENISSQYKKSKNIIKRFFPEHRDYSRIGYFLFRLLKKIKSN